MAAPDPPQSCSVEEVLRIAAQNDRFLAALVRDPDRALAARQLRLNPSDLAMLRSVGADQLRAIVAHLADPTAKPRPVAPTPPYPAPGGVRPR